MKSRQQQGLDNSYVANPSKSNWDIIRSNTFTLFNVTIFIIAAAILAVGSFINSLFILLFIFNITLGIVVEIRARRIVDKLALLNTDPVVTIRDGEKQEVQPRDIVMDDVLILEAGNQVPTDSLVLSGCVEVDESLLMGESDLLVKQEDAQLLSGSFIASGQCYVRVKHVGADNYSTKLSLEAKQYRPIDSGLMKALGVVMKFVSWIALPLGIILLIQALFFSHVDMPTAILATTAGLLGMIPRGMVVLIAVTLVTGVIKLGRRKVLVQEMYSIETMAHLDTLCLDKTGTITEGKMQPAGVYSFDNFSDEFVQRALGAYLATSVDNNSTMKALREAYLHGDDLEATARAVIGSTAHQCVHFSSQRKWGAVEFSAADNMSDDSRLAVSDDIRKLGTLVLGAPEKLTQQSFDIIEAKQKEGYRVLMLGYCSDVPRASSTDSDKTLDVVPLGCILLDDPVRETAATTLSYLRDQGVDLKIVSGDNPETVSIIAKRAGFSGYKHYVDASKLNDEQLAAAVEDTAIFGRVSPQQKKLIVTTLRSCKKTVGMVGDGVNDILAMREANLSMAMATGDAAAKQIANLILLKSDFADMPEILYEARRVVNNMLRSASIFFIKTIYSLFLMIVSSISMMAGGLFLFPFVAIQVTLADQTIGWPTFYFSFRKDRTPITKDFLKTALMRALPNALLITASFLFIHFYGMQQDWSTVDIVTLMYCSLGIITFYNVARACWPLNLHNAVVLLLTLSGYFAGLYVLGPFIGLGTLTAATAPVFAAIVIVSLLLWLLWNRVARI